MGCCFKIQKYAKKRNRITTQTSDLRVGQKQGVAELKQNYHIDQKTKLLGKTKYGDSVFNTWNNHNRDFKVAIKVIDKNKIEK